MNHLEISLFYIAALTTVVGSAVVVINRRPAYGVLALALAMLALSVLFTLLHAYFVAIIQVLIYAGAILVLFLFVIMLLGIEGQDPTQGTQRKSDILSGKIRRWVNAVLLIAFLVEVLIVTSAVQNASSLQKDLSGTIEAVGEALFTQYLLPFELVSGILLIGIFGVVNLAQKEFQKRT